MLGPQGAQAQVSQFSANQAPITDFDVDHQFGAGLRMGDLNVEESQNRIK